MSAAAPPAPPEKIVLRAPPPFVPAFAPAVIPLPDHNQLPETDGSIVENSQEHPQGNILTDTLAERLACLYGPQGFFVGLDTGIFWTPTEPPLAGCKSPDWYVVPGVQPMLDGQVRRSYVMYREILAPAVVMQFVSRDDGGERDTTPGSGKFWVYERGIRAPWYVIFDAPRRLLEVYRLVDGRYERQEANPSGRYLVPPLLAELGIWEGTYRGITGAWLRPWDPDTGQMISMTEEREAAQRQRADQERQRAEDAERERDRLRERLRAAGIDPDA
ncbi:MAG: Uma2 family endonuclease [Gemmataceae bacterium]|nr:Uma2 family endonuclease [Gemmataceae bacterium]